MKYDVGDLVQDITYPEDGMAIVLDYSMALGYKLFAVQLGKTYWYDKEYVEIDCEKVEVTNEQNSQQSNQSHAGQ